MRTRHDPCAHGMLHARAGTVRNLSFLAFWLQFALSLVSAGILLFSVAFVPRVRASTRSRACAPRLRSCVCATPAAG